MKVKFLPQDVEYEIEPGQSVLDLAHKHNLPIHSTCNGLPSCAECRVKVVEGDYNLIPPSKKEMSLIGTGYYIDGRRLACQMSCFGDVVVDMSEHLEREKAGSMTKKFLSRVQKESADQTHSVGDVLIQKDNQLLQELGGDVEVDSSEISDHKMFSEMLKGGDGRSQKSRDKSSKGRSSRDKSNSKKSAQKSSAGGGSDSESRSKNRNRNRYRNRNKNRGGSNEKKGSS